METQTSNEQIVKSYVRNKKPVQVTEVRPDHTVIAVIITIYLILVLAKLFPVLFSALVVSTMLGYGYKYWNDHRVIIYDDTVEPEPAPKAKRRYRKQSDYFKVYRDGQLVQTIYQGKN